MFTRFVYNEIIKAAVIQRDFALSVVGCGYRMQILQAALEFQ